VPRFGRGEIHRLLTAKIVTDVIVKVGEAVEEAVGITVVIRILRDGGDPKRTVTGITEGEEEPDGADRSGLAFLSLMLLHRFLQLCRGRFRILREDLQPIADYFTQSPK
jgi:hypothetical protein